MIYCLFLVQVPFLPSRFSLLNYYCRSLRRNVFCDKFNGMTKTSFAIKVFRYVLFATVFTLYLLLL